MTWTGVTNSPRLAGLILLKIYGSITFVAGMTQFFFGAINFESITLGKTITTAGKSFY